MMASSLSSWSQGQSTLRHLKTPLLPLQESLSWQTAYSNAKGTSVANLWTTKLVCVFYCLPVPALLLQLQRRLQLLLLLKPTLDYNRPGSLSLRSMHRKYAFPSLLQDCVRLRDYGPSRGLLDTSWGSLQGRGWFPRTNWSAWRHVCWKRNSHADHSTTIMSTRSVSSQRWTDTHCLQDLDLKSPLDQWFLQSMDLLITLRATASSVSTFLFTCPFHWLLYASQISWVLILIVNILRIHYTRSPMHDCLLVSLSVCTLIHRICVFYCSLCVYLYSVVSSLFLCVCVWCVGHSASLQSKSLSILEIIVGIFLLLVPLDFCCLSQLELMFKMEKWHKWWMISTVERPFC